MEQDDRDFPDSEWEARIEAAYRRTLQGLPPVPWLPRMVDIEALRRQVARARAGVVEPENPNISTRAWADTLEQGIVMNVLENRQQRKEIAEEKQREALDRQLAIEHNKRWFKILKILKKLPDAADPNSEIAAQIRLMERELRQLRNRPRGRKRRKGRRESPPPHPSINR